MVMHDTREESLIDAVGKPQANGNLDVGSSPLKQGEAALGRYVPQLGKMSEQLKQTSKQIEDAVVGVCDSFQGIAVRARATVARAAGFLGREGQMSTDKQSFEGLIEACSATLVKLMDTTAEASDISHRAMERIQEMDRAGQQISDALGQLDVIASGNRMLAFNARIEAAHAGSAGSGFAVVAVELAAQTVKSRSVTAQVSELVLNLRELAESTLVDLRRMNEKESARVEQCRQEVDESLKDLQAVHSEMAEVLSGITAEGAMLATDISSAVRGMQFQDRISQRIAHVIADLDTLTERFEHVGNFASSELAADEGFSAYTMREERAVGGSDEEEATGGDVELF
jgi:methyl-accepting chemotaxis protein